VLSRKEVNEAVEMAAEDAMRSMSQTSPAPPVIVLSKAAGEPPCRNRNYNAHHQIWWERSVRRWQLAPKKFSGMLAFEGQSIRVRFSAEISNKGAPKARLEALPYDASTMFISDAFHDQQGKRRFAQFTLTGQARDGATFHSDAVIIPTLGSQHSDSAASTMEPKLWCTKCKIVLPAKPNATTGVRFFLKGFDCIKPLSAQCRLGTIELRGPMSLKPSEKNHVTGELTIDGPPANAAFPTWREDVDHFFKHVRSILSFARGAQLHAPIVETVWDGRVEVVAHHRSDDDSQPAAVFTPFNYEAIFHQAVASHFAEKPKAKNISIAIEWFTMQHGYREAKLTSAMTVLEHLLTNNLSRGDMELRKDKQAKKVRAAMLDAAKLALEELGVSSEEIEAESATMRDKLEDINRRPLKDKIYLLARRWGVPMDGIDDEALGAAKRARDHVVHRGQYLPKDPTEDLMDHVRLARELVVRFVLAAMEFEGAYASPLTGDQNRMFKILPPAAQ